MANIDCAALWRLAATQAFLACYHLGQRKFSLLLGQTCNQLQEPELPLGLRQKCRRRAPLSCNYLHPSCSAHHGGDCSRRWHHRGDDTNDFEAVETVKRMARCPSGLASTARRPVSHRAFLHRGAPQRAAVQARVWGLLGPTLAIPNRAQTAD